MILRRSQAYQALRLLLLLTKTYQDLDLDMRHIAKLFNSGIDVLDGYGQLLERSCNLIFFGSFELTSARP